MNCISYNSLEHKLTYTKELPTEFNEELLFTLSELFFNLQKNWVNDVLPELLADEDFKRLYLNNNKTFTYDKFLDFNYHRFYQDSHFTVMHLLLEQLEAKGYRVIKND